MLQKIQLSLYFFKLQTIYIKKMYSMKKFVNLTESDLHRIIKSSVKAYLKENQQIESKLHEFSDLENKSDDELEKLAKKAYKLGLADMIFGTLATLISCILVYSTPKLIKNEKLSLFIASLWPTIVNASIIGWELYKFFGLPFALSAFQVGFGEFVVITIVGLPVFKMVNNKYGNRIKIFNSK